MRVSRQIILVWGGLIGLYLISLPFADLDILLGADILNRAVQTLLFVLSVYITIKEPCNRNRAIFLNFSVFFGVCTVMMLQPFVGHAFLQDEPYAFFLFWQYSAIAYSLFLAFSVIYLVIDLLFREFKTIQKYAIALGISLAFFTYYYAPFVADPLYLYKTEETQQLKAIQTVIGHEIETPTAAELASRLTLQAWRDGKPIGDLFPEENLKKIEVLLPYTEGEKAWMVIFTKPMYMNYIYMNVLTIGFILLFFGYQYKKDPPQGAYIDKMMFLFLIFCSMEILHFWEYIKSIEWNYYMEISTLGQYITIFIEILIAVFFTLRLRFITSVQGEFYETELARNPNQVSRWRDWVDNLVLTHFFNSNPLRGRLFQGSSSPERMQSALTTHPSHKGSYGQGR